MGVNVYSLREGEFRPIRIGQCVHQVGVIGRLWKVTETDLRDGRAETLDAIADAEQMGQVLTPRVVIVDDVAEFGERREIRASQVLGWPRGKLQTQDLDWDHLPELGWAVQTQAGTYVLHERDGESLTPINDARATYLGILEPDGSLAEQHVPTIAECRSVRTIFENYYDADCVLNDGRAAHVLGESETGRLPLTTWFVGRTVEAAAKYRLPDELASESRRGS